MIRYNRVVVAVSGATGIEYAVRLMKVLKQKNIEVHYVISKPGEMTRAYETEYSSKDLKSLADHVYSNADVGAAIASGSYPIDGMIIVPASMKIVAEVANGTGDSLMARAADVMLKERRRLILCARETPLSLVHIENMRKLTMAGGIVMPPVPAFYHKPKRLDDIVDDFIYRVLDVFGLECDEMKRWGDFSLPS